MTASGKMSEEARQKLRNDFLLSMYKAMWDNINRHITVLWQAVAVLGATFGVAFFAGRDTATWQQSPVFDFAASLMIALSCWLFAHAIDASRWFNRNIQIIANIESTLRRLLQEDEYPHPYMRPQFRRGSDMPDHMRIQSALAVILAITALVTHTAVRIAPEVGRECFPVGCPLRFTQALPAISLLASFFLARRLYSRAKRKHREFEESFHTPEQHSPYQRKARNAETGTHSSREVRDELHRATTH